MTTRAAPLAITICLSATLVGCSERAPVYETDHDANVDASEDLLVSKGRTRGDDDLTIDQLDALVGLWQR
jgi:hypothetical protein